LPTVIEPRTGARGFFIALGNVTFDHFCLVIVNGGVKTCHWGGAKGGHLFPRLGA